MIKATSVIHSNEAPADTVTLSYDDRHKRRIVMNGDNGRIFLLDLPKATELQHGSGWSTCFGTKDVMGCDVKFRTFPSTA